MIKGIIIAVAVIGAIIGFGLLGLYCCMVIGSDSDGDDFED